MTLDPRRPLRPALAGLALLALGAATLAGCGKPPTLSTDEKDGGRDKGDPWDVAGKRLRKDTDVAALKLVLAGLNSDLPAVPAAPRPAALAADAEGKLAALVPLSPEDLAEVRPASFSTHDAVYLAECLLFRDAARSLDVPARPGRTPEQEAADRADLGFAWVCRQVYVNPWLAPPRADSPDSLVIGLNNQPVIATALPPTQVLRRGYGSGLERAYVFLALLQQSGLDGCLVGPPGARDKPAGFVAVSGDGKTLLTGSPRGPFWAVGVRVGADVRLYDPWRGVAFPAPLSALRADPDAHKGWFEDPRNVTGVAAGDLPKAAVYLAVPVNALSPRMATLEAQPAVKAGLGAKVAVDPAALRAAFPDPKPEFWNPPADGFAYGRTARTVLPAELGGADRSPRGPGRLYESYLRDQLPPAVTAPPREMGDSPEAAERLRTAVLVAYGAAFLGIKPPDLLEVTSNPREKIARGEFQDAARDLVARQDQFFQGRDRLRTTPDADAQIRAWAERARELYARFGLAAASRDAPARAEAEAAIENHWRTNAPVVQLVVDRVGAEVGFAEATLLLARCKHEQAERLQAQLDRAAGADADALRKDAAAAWETARREWRTYAERSRSQAGFPGRAAHVRAQADRAEGFAGGK